MSNWTVAQLKEEIEKLGFKPPSGLRKDDLVLFYVGARVMIEKNIPQIDLKKVKSLSMLCSHSAHSTNTQCPLPDCLHPTPVKANPSMDWKTHLYTYGWAIRKIPNFDPKAIREGLLNWLHRVCPQFDPQNPETWSREHIPFNLHGIFKHWVGHLPELWQTREACYETFADLWQSPDLLSSFDGFCFLPGANSRKTSAAYKQWIHCDQGRKFRYFACVQGIVNLFPNGPADGGTILMSGSHARFDAYLDNHPIEGLASFFPIDPLDWTLKGCQMVKPCLEEGEILLFDSRTFHCNLAPLSNNPRMCVYISMMPRSGANQEELTKRQKLYTEGRMTGHWCYGPFFNVCEKEPRELYSQNTPKPAQLEIAQLNPVKARLAGF